MTAAKKFMFDVAFDSEKDLAEVEVANTQETIGAEAEVEIEAPTFSQQDIDSARNEGFERGREEATRELATAVERQTLDMLATIGTRLNELFESEQQADAAHAREAVVVSLSIVRKLFPHLSDAHGAQEVEALVLRAMSELTEETKVTLRLHPDMLVLMKEKISALAAETRFKGSIEFHGDEAMEKSDCRITWGMGGIARSTADIWHKIDEIVEENLGPDTNTEATSEISPETGDGTDDNSVPATQETIPDAGDDHG